MPKRTKKKATKKKATKKKATKKKATKKATKNAKKPEVELDGDAVTDAPTERIPVRSSPAGDVEAVLTVRYFKVMRDACYSCETGKPVFVRTASTTKGRTVFATLCEDCVDDESKQLMQNDFLPSRSLQALVNTRYIAPADPENVEPEPPKEPALKPFVPAAVRGAPSAGGD